MPVLELVNTTLYTSPPFHLSTEYISPNLEGKKKNANLQTRLQMFICPVPYNL